MASLQELPLTSLSLKRKIDDIDGPEELKEHMTSSSNAESLPTPPVSHSNNSSPAKLSPAVARATSPSASSSLTSVPENAHQDGSTNNAMPGAPPQKKRKLTPAEKLQKQQEREAKAKERAEAKAKREEEKRVEEEEKQRKRGEREEKRRQKDFEEQQKKQQRDLVKQKEEEEKAKKERSQMRLNSFFTKPKATQAPTPASPAKSLSIRHAASPCKPKPNIIEVGDMGATTTGSPSKPAPTSSVSDYDRRFLPFSVPANTVLAPENHFHTSKTDSDASSARFERIIASSAPTSLIRAELVDNLATDGSMVYASSFMDKSVQDIVAEMQGSQTKLAGLTAASNAKMTSFPQQQLKKIPLKYIHYEQDVRPPYYGTYSKIMPQREAKHLARSSCSSGLPNIDYDYDSEAEWEEPEEGEDLLSDGEDDGESLEGEDDMEGFLDDENDTLAKRRVVVATDLEPQSSGLCWQNEHGEIRRADGGSEEALFKGFTLGVLLRDPPGIIDPFSTTYWESDAKKTLNTSSATVNISHTTSMQPPTRVPLNPIPNGGNAKIMEDFTGKQVPGPALLNPQKRRGRPPKSETGGKVKRTVPDEQMNDFKSAIDGSDLTKIALVEDLKKRYVRPFDTCSTTFFSKSELICALFT